jgi:hypothetical protein
MTSQCCHHWVIETAAGPDSKGRCKFCRAEKIFTNYMPVITIKDHVMLQKAQRQSRDYQGGLTPYFGVRTSA